MRIGEEQGKKDSTNGIQQYTDENYESHPYEDIINLPHHVSIRHPQMDLLDRAAQFSPFAALTGHAEAI